MPLPGPPAQTHLPHGVEEKETPDGKRYWIDYRPSKPSWDDPRASSGDPLPPGVERYITPDGVPYFVNRSPRVTWMDPRSRPARPQGKYENASEKSMVSSDLGRDLEGKEDVPRSYLTLPSPGPLPVTAHVEYALLMDLTRWRFAQVLSGYPDARSADVDTIILLLKTRLKVADPSVLEPIEDSYIQACRTLISSEPNLNLFAIPGSKEGTPQGGISELSFWGMLKPTIYFLLLGIPSSYQRRISRADWVQWASSKRWIDQRENFGAFMNSLISEWNLINLISTLFFSATVGFLSINELAMIPAAATLISMMFSMGSLTMSVSLIWRYQRQLTQVTEMRTIMDEFIYRADAEVLTILLSLPVSFLLWSVIAFAVAVVSYAWSYFPQLVCPIGATASLGLVFVISTATWFYHIYRMNVVTFWKHLREGPTGV